MRLLRRVGSATLLPFRLAKRSVGWCWRGVKSLGGRCWRQIKFVLSKLTSKAGLAVLGTVAVAFALGILVAQFWTSDSPSDVTGPDQPELPSEPSSPDQPPGSTSESSANNPSEPQSPSTSTDSANGTNTDPESTNTESASTTPEPAATPVVIVLEQEPLPYESAMAIAAGLAPHTIYPSGCQSPLHIPDLMPNAPRAYRFGIHQGVDFRCFALGHSAVAALDGRVVLTVGDYRDPDADDRDRLLEVAAELEDTPPYTLLSLYGNYVVIDHGVIPFVGHVVTVYAHLHEVDPEIRVGQTIKAGERVGEIGNKGTHAAASGDFYDDPHLHWELHVNDLYLGAGLSESETRDVYTTLFSQALG